MVLGRIFGTTWGVVGYYIGLILLFPAFVYMALAPTHFVNTLIGLGWFIVQCIVSFFQLVWLGLYYVFGGLVVLISNLFIGLFNSIIKALNDALGIAAPLLNYLQPPNISDALAKIGETLRNGASTVAQNFDSLLNQSGQNLQNLGIPIADAKTTGTVAGTAAAAAGGVTAHITRTKQGGYKYEGSKHALYKATVKTPSGETIGYVTSNKPNTTITIHPSDKPTATRKVPIKTSSGKTVYITESEARRLLRGY